ncbi:MAG: hypothetical protein HY078_16740 [Elusimicrobia bacterium]|nr:hypothetical protein [Elusimicrobiota bacterium]
MFAKNEISFGRTLVPAALALWIGICLAGFKVVLDYEGTPGVAASAPERWPAETRFASGGGRSSLVLFAHPHCPCTKASLESLAWIAARAPRTLDAYVAFYRPSGAADWDATPLIASARAIPGVRVLVDENGAEARRFGAETSGQALLYDAKGRLLFKGGITGARGHTGDNVGRNAVLALADGSLVQAPESSVFGCSLLKSIPERASAKARWGIAEWTTAIAKR